ncbi:hypothetical protein VNO80_14833 [Phaseolus coccineus]|uniref:Uncharacterized protein n=1 Tax=Phaseolus coccineus TaxID=3886 RepID=A0AAN9MNU7_PHACN
MYINEKAVTSRRLWMREFCSELLIINENEMKYCKVISIPVPVFSYSGSSNKSNLNIVLTINYPNNIHI